LIGPREFVDRRQNSIVPPSNEFLPQIIENTNGHVLPSRRFLRKNVIFVVFAPLAARAEVALSARMALCVEPTHHDPVERLGALDIRDAGASAISS
jgi:hypothetical protein